MKETKHLRWVPNAITSIRLVAVVPVTVCTLLGLWEWAFGVYVLALISDFFDGLMARKLNVASHFGELLDAWSDTALSAAAVLSLTITGYIPLAVPVAILVGGLLLRYPLWRPERAKSLAATIHMFEVGSLFLVIVYVLWTYAALIFGWYGWYIPATVALLVTLAILKRRRLQVWCAAILPKRWRPKES